MARCRFTFEDGENGQLKILGETEPLIDLANPPANPTEAQKLFIAMAAVIVAVADEELSTDNQQQSEN